METLRWAVAQLRHLLVRPAVSSLYLSRPDSPIPQPAFYNLVVLGESTLDAEHLLAFGKQLERLAGRQDGPRLGPRPLDVDLLFHGSRQSPSPELTLPHPRLRQRPFVLAPLAEIAPRLELPPDGATPTELLARLPTAADDVRRLPDALI